MIISITSSITSSINKRGTKWNHRGIPEVATKGSDKFQFINTQRRRSDTYEVNYFNIPLFRPNLEN